MRLRQFACTLALLALFVPALGCADLTVGPSAPQPNILVPQKLAPASLVLGPAIQDDFLIPATRSVSEVPVQRWRQTLTTGFRNAFPAARGEPGRKLELIEAELSFGPAAVSPQMFDRTTAVYGTIRFKARLLSATGEEEAAIAGTVHSREANVSATTEGMTESAMKVVEALYERLATDLVSRPPPAPAPAPSPPAPAPAAGPSATGGPPAPPPAPVLPPMPVPPG
jgi:hypothetical protein